MDIINSKVKSKILGVGTVVAQDESRVTVQFASKKSSFQYPEAFRNFLTVKDAEIQQMIHAEIEAVDKEKKMKEKEKRETMGRAKLEDMNVKAGYKTVNKSMKRLERVKGQYLTFLIFQGDTFEKEYKGGYIWAPKLNQSGRKCHHWDKLLDVREGDIIIHCANGYVEAISIAKGTCFDSDSPDEITDEKLWAKAGRMIQCDYIKIQNPIKYSNYKDIILQYCGVKYSPFDKDGNGNMGYLFDLNYKLAKFFVEKSAVNNSYLLNVKWIQEFLIGHTFIV